MKIPQTLKIGGHIVSIDCSQELENENGNSKFSKNLINICKTLPQDQQEATLIHEILHYLNSTLGGESTLSHCLLDSLAEQIYQVLKDNNLLK
jgi:hypothetical protein